MRRQYKNNHKLHIVMITAGACTMLTLAGCSLSTGSTVADTSGSSSSEQAVTEVDSTTSDSGNAVSAVSDPDAVATTWNSSGDGILDTTDLFTDRDLAQTADLTDAVYYTVSDGEDIHITAEGVYVISGSAKNVTIYVEAASEDKVQLVLNDLTITNEDFPCIYATEADKVLVTTTDSENSLSVTGTFITDGDTNTDGVILSKTDLVLNGTGSLTISSTDNGIVGKDDLKITGGTYNITASSKTMEANDSIRIAAGTFTLVAGMDGLHAENDEDDSVGYIYIADGTFHIQAGDDGIHAESAMQMDGGTYDITAAEGLESTYIQINDGTINIQASDDGINAANKSSAYHPTVEINGGYITIVMGAGDTDGVDSNGDIVINGGTLDVTGNSGFDYDGSGVINGGTVIVNGEEVDTLPNQFMGGPGGMNDGNGGMFPGGGMNDGNGGEFPGGGMNDGNRGRFPGGGMNDGNGGMFPGGGMNDGNGGMFPGGVMNDSNGENYPVAE